MPQAHIGGDKLLIDYAGDTVPVIVDRLTGQVRPAQIFVAVMGASNFTPAFVFGPGRLARWGATVASCLLLEGAAVARGDAARPVSPQEGPARLRRDRHESGGAARGRSLWTHRGERLGKASTPRQADRGERSLMHLKLHANATTTPRTRTYIRQSRASNTALARELGIHRRTVARWKGRRTLGEILLVEAT